MGSRRDRDHVHVLVPRPSIVITVTRQDIVDIVTSHHHRPRQRDIGIDTGMRVVDVARDTRGPSQDRGLGQGLDRVGLIRGEIVNENRVVVEAEAEVEGEMINKDHDVVIVMRLEVERRQIIVLDLLSKLIKMLFFQVSFDY